MKSPWLCISLCSMYALGKPLPATAEYTARQFFQAAPLEIFYTEDEMSAEDRKALVQSGFKLQRRFNCQQWGIAEETSTSLVLKYCEDSFVRIHVYAASNGDSVVAVESNRSDGRAIDLAFFRVSSATKAIQPLGPTELPTIGLDPLTENDFLLDAEHFTSSENTTVPLSLERDGTLTGALNTWMNPRWENRKPAYAVTFVWNGQRFERTKTPKTPKG